VLPLVTMEKLPALTGATSQVGVALKEPEIALAELIKNIIAGLQADGIAGGLEVDAVVVRGQRTGDDDAVICCHWPVWPTSR